MPETATPRGAAVPLIGLAALIPTILSAWGMIGVGHQVLKLDLAVAVALSAFLELALIGFALLARDAVLSGRPAGQDLAATWVISAASGAFSACHEIVAADGSWQLDAQSGLAAAVRITAPLVAAALWHRILVGDQHAGENRRTRAQARRDEHLHAVASAALDVRRAGPQSRTEAMRALDQAHLKLLKHHPPVTDQQDTAVALSDWLRAVGSVDDLPQATAGPRQQASADDVPAPRAPQAQPAPAVTVTSRGPLTGDQKLQVAVAHIKGRPQATGVSLTAAMRDAGWTSCSVRSGNRWLDKGREHLTATAASN